VLALIYDTFDYQLRVYYMLRVMIVLSHG
jgi:hypothetical protein